MATSSDVKTYYEIYSQIFVDGQSKYCLSTQDGQLVSPTDIRSGQTGSAPMPFIELADFNRDGMTDLAFSTEKGVLNVLLNQFTAPGPKATNLCNDVGNTAQIKAGGIYPTYPFDADSAGVVQEALSTKAGEKVDMKISYAGITPSIIPSTTSPGVVGRLRVSDVDQDGYPDFAMTLNFSDKTIESSPKTITRSVILLN